MRRRSGSSKAPQTMEAMAQAIAEVSTPNMCGLASRLEGGAATAAEQLLAAKLVNMLPADSAIDVL